jgi:hypothetical protein
LTIDDTAGMASSGPHWHHERQRGRCQNGPKSAPFIQDVLSSILRAVALRPERRRHHAASHGGGGAATRPARGVGVDFGRLRRMIENSRDAVLTRAGYAPDLFGSCCAA